MRFPKKADRRASVAALAGAAIALVLLFSGAALAHAAYESSDPADGASVSSPPSQVTANYTEPLAEGDSYMDVTDPCGRDVGGETSITADSMTVSMKGTAEGEYVVKWRARSTVDNHVTTGNFSFTSTGGDPCPGEEPEPEEEATEKESSAGAGNHSSSNAASGSDGSASAPANDKSSTADGGGRAGAGTESRNKKAGGRGASEDEVKGNIVAASPPVEENDPSTLEGIPIGGLLVTLLLAALIGAAAGKIYFSLSGESG